MYSALKHQGQPLYKLARKGQQVERAAREIDIHDLELLGFAADTLRARVSCSKGTYIRVLVEQLGTALGSCAHLTALRRDYVEPFRAARMHTLEQLEALRETPPLLSADTAVGHLPALKLTAGQARAIGFGQEITVPGPYVGPLRLYDGSGQFMGLGRALEGGVVRSSRLFVAGHAGNRN